MIHKGTFCVSSVRPVKNIISSVKKPAECRLHAHLCGEKLKTVTDITGARWRLDRAEAVLRLRALRASRDFDEYWQFHKMQEFQRNHVNKFQDPERLLAI